MWLELDQVCFSYASKEVLHGIDLEVPESSFLALIGPNGSGKSTLVKVMGGLLAPDSGQVVLQGRPVRSYPPRELARRLAVIPSEHHFDFPFLVRDVVAMGRFAHLGPLQGLRPLDREAIEEALELTSTRELADRSISELSSGERQLVLIARALAQQPSALILDEPNSHLDINHQIAVFRLLNRLHRDSGKTIVVVLHDLTMVGAFCHTVALMQQGRVLRVGSPREIITEEIIRETYGVQVQVVVGPQGNPVLSYPAEVSPKLEIRNPRSGFVRD